MSAAKNEKRHNKIVQLIQEEREAGVNDHTRTMIEEVRKALEEWEAQVDDSAEQAVRDFAAKMGVPITIGELAKAAAPAPAPAVKRGRPPGAKGGAAGSIDQRVAELVAYLKKNDGAKAGAIQGHFGWSKGTWATTSQKAIKDKGAKMKGERRNATWHAL